MAVAAAPQHDAAGRVDLKSFDLPGLKAWCAAELGLSPQRALAIYKHLWQDGVADLASMDQVAAPVREALAAKAYVHRLRPALELPSDDGTIKFLWQLEDGHTIESVLIPDGQRVTLCLSSQVGCAMACAFCLTGDLGLKRHLKPSEIAGQVLQVGKAVVGRHRLTNLVVMGMGEPLHNLDNLVVALRNCLHDHALNFSHRRVTVSTVGLVPKMAELAAALPVNLAVSLNATTEAQRREIMPITRKHSLAELMEACRTFPLPSGKRIIFEYVMFDGFNDTLDDAERLVELLRDVPAKVNLIPYNENPERTLRRPPPERVAAFRAHLHARGTSCTVRSTRGLDVSAACGQLGKAWDQATAWGRLPSAPEPTP